jgi:hypothetical protein
MIEDLGFKIEVDYQTAVEKGPQLRSQSLAPPQRAANEHASGVSSPCDLAERLLSSRTREILVFVTLHNKNLPL